MPVIYPELVIPGFALLHHCATQSLVLLFVCRRGSRAPVAPIEVRR